MELTELRKLQLLEVSLLQKFQQICDLNHITYYFVGGGLIGVLRHGGFIPWDDDMDIVMPRDDYDKFIEICKTGIGNGYAIVSDWNYILSRFVDLESIIERPSAFEALQENVWIDLFPIDGMPNNVFLRWLHMKYALLLRYILILTDVSRLAGKKKRPFYEAMILHFFNYIPLFKLLKKERVCKMLDRCMRRYRYNTSKYCCNLIGRYRSKEIQLKERWGNPVSLVFEGIEVKVPHMYHEFQTHIYGDYMQLPPENQRVAHEVKLLRHRDVDFTSFEERSKISRK